MGMSYKLTIDLTPEQLEAFGNTGSQIAIAKSAESPPTVVWQSLRPIEELVMTWEENYGIYATETEFKGGAKIISTARVKGTAVNGEEYALVKNGFFVAQENPGNPKSYYARNLYSAENKSMGFGLTQMAELSSGLVLPPNPVSYAPVLFESMASMTPYTTLYVWVESKVQGGSVVTEVTGPQLPVPYGNGVNEHVLVYNKGKFELKDGKAGKGGARAEAFVPTYY
jgi:hypothetical protein